MAANMRRYGILLWFFQPFGTPNPNHHPPFFFLMQVLVCRCALLISSSSSSSVLFSTPPSISRCCLSHKHTHMLSLSLARSPLPRCVHCSDLSLPPGSAGCLPSSLTRSLSCSPSLCVSLLQPHTFPSCSASFLLLPPRSLHLLIFPFRRKKFESAFVSTLFPPRLARTSLLQLVHLPFSPPILFPLILLLSSSVPNSLFLLYYLFISRLGRWGGGWGVGGGGGVLLAWLSLGRLAQFMLPASGHGACRGW